MRQSRPAHVRVFLSYSRRDVALLRELDRHLAILRGEDRIELWWESEIEAGDDWAAEIGNNVETAQLFLLLVSPDFIASDVLNSRELHRMLERHASGAARVIPIILRPCDWQATSLAKLQMLPRDGQPITRWEDRDTAFMEVVQGIRRAVESLGSPPATRAAEVSLWPSELRARRIRLRNIRCFEVLDLDLTVEGRPAPLVLLVGENSSGKSTLLRSLALGLASGGEAAALLKQLPGGLLRQGEDRGSIELELEDSGVGASLLFRTDLFRESNGEDGIAAIFREPNPAEFFVCAYGTGRSREAISSYKRYSLHQALLPLFDDDASLQNPELILLRQDPPVRAQLEDRLLKVLMLDDAQTHISYESSGAQLHTRTGDHALRTLSDGYRSTAQWLLDFLSWAIYAGRLRNGDPIGGILIIDEIEQHLHPRWQRHILQRLHQQLAGTQIVTSSHTPLVAAATADIEGALVVRLEADAEGKVSARRVERDEIAGLRADQVLAELFGLYTSRSPGSQDDISRYAELLGKRGRTAADEAELKKLRQQLETSLHIGENQVQKKVEEAMDQALEGMLAAYKPELVDFEKRRLLKDLFEKA